METKLNLFIRTDFDRIETECSASQVVVRIRGSAPYRLPIVECIGNHTHTYKQMLNAIRESLNLRLDELMEKL
jgi:hypothetical protein